MKDDQKKRVPQIELPPARPPKPAVEKHNLPRDVSEPAKEEKTASFVKSCEIKDQAPAREPAGDGAPADAAASLQRSERSPASDGTSAGWIFAGVMIVVAVIFIASRSSAPQSPDFVQQTAVGVDSSTPKSVTATPWPEPAPPQPAPQPSTPQIQRLAMTTPAVAQPPRISRPPSHKVSAATPAPKAEVGRNYVWRGKSYYIPPDKMPSFNAIKKAGVPKLAAIQKLQDQIESIGWQMANADKKTRIRLAQQRDEVSAQLTQTTAEYKELASQMDQLLSTVANP